MTVNQMFWSPSEVKNATIGFFKNSTVNPVHANTTSTISTCQPFLRFHLFCSLSIQPIYLMFELPPFRSAGKSY